MFSCVFFLVVKKKRDFTRKLENAFEFLLKVEPGSKVFILGGGGSMFTHIFLDDCGIQAGILQRFLPKMVAPWHENLD